MEVAERREVVELLEVWAVLGVSELVVVGFVVLVAALGLELEETRYEVAGSSELLLEDLLCEVMLDDTMAEEVLLDGVVLKGIALEGMEIDVLITLNGAVLLCPELEEAATALHFGIES